MNGVSPSAFDRHDVLVAIGLACCVIGAGLAWLPAGLIVAGAGCIGWGVLADLGARKPEG